MRRDARSILLAVIGMTLPAIGAVQDREHVKGAGE